LKKFFIELLGLTRDDEQLRAVRIKNKKEDINQWLKSHQLNLHIRSSLSAKYGLIIANGTGIIDLDYEDEIMICLHSPIIAVSKLTYLNFQRTLGDL